MAKSIGGRWEIVRSLGEGGQGRVYLVNDLSGEYPESSVLKRLKNVNRLNRFENEIKAVKGLQHPNITKLFDYSLDGTEPFFVTEYCIGGSLAKIENPFWKDNPIIALQLFKDIADAVAFAHAHSIIHRDIKPENIYLRSSTGPAVIGDFGLSYIGDDGNRATLTDEAVGSFHYIPPELADGRTHIIDSRSDTYSLGKVLYWLLAGRIFNREQHRDRSRDLRRWNDLPGAKKWDRPILEHVNRLLDMMIKENYEDRHHVASIALLVPEVIDLLQGGYNPIAPDMLGSQKCQYCGQGTYRLVADRNDIAGNFGFEGRGNPDPRVFVCNTCGHVQTFRVDFAKEKGWWSASQTK